ncbi:MAG: hypothetical protein RR327_00535, partial [Clostridia bacterium]
LSTRFVAQFLLFIFSKVSGKIERLLLSFEKTERKPSKNTYFSKLKLKLNSKFRKKTSGEKSDIPQKPRRKIPWKNVLFQLYKFSKNVAECVFELAYFWALGIVTLWIFSLFEFVDFFWFIPLSVVGGAVTNNYLTKELFAKKT